ADRAADEGGEPPAEPGWGGGARLVRSLSGFVGHPWSPKAAAGVGRRGRPASPRDRVRRMTTRHNPEGAGTSSSPTAGAADRIEILARGLVVSEGSVLLCRSVRGGYR